MPEIRKRLIRKPVLAIMPEEKILVTLSKDDELMLLIDEHTNNMYKGKTRKATLQFLALMAHGTPRRTACRLTGVKRTTTDRWINQPWYKQALEIIKSQIDETIENTYTNVIVKSQQAVLDRLDNGDYQLDKNGKLLRKPVSAKDAAIVGSISFDKRNLLRGKPINISENKTTEDRLSDLQERFRQFANANEINDAEYEEVENEEAEQGAA